MPKCTIIMRPHFSRTGKINGWCLQEGNSGTLNRNRKDALDGLRTSIHRYQKAGYTVEAKILDREEQLEAHGLYKPDGTMETIPVKRTAPAASLPASRSIVDRRSWKLSASGKTYALAVRQGQFKYNLGTGNLWWVWKPGYGPEDGPYSVKIAHASNFDPSIRHAAESHLRTIQTDEGD